MALAAAVISYSLADLVGTTPNANNLRRWGVWADTNVPGDTIIDTDANLIRLGSGNGTVAVDGTGSISVWIPGAGSNPETWQTTITVKYPDKNAPTGRGVRTFGPFTITASGNLADLVEEQEIPATYLSAVTDMLDDYVDSASASATAAAASATSAAASAVLAQNASAVAALIVVAGGTVDLDDTQDDGYLIGYKVTATTTIEGTSFAAGSYIFERDSSVFGGWTYRTLDASVPVVAPILDAPVIVVGTPTQTTIPLTWAAVTDAAGYVLQVDAGAWVDLGSVTSYTITGLAAGATYTINLAAYETIPASPGNIDTEIVNTAAAPTGVDFFVAANGTALTSHTTEIAWLTPSSTNNGVTSTIGTIVDRSISGSVGGMAVASNDSMITVRYSSAGTNGDQIRLHARGKSALINVRGTLGVLDDTAGLGTSVGTTPRKYGYLTLKVVGSTVTVYHDGVQVATFAAATATSDKWGFATFGNAAVFGVKIEAATSGSVPTMGFGYAADATITSETFTGTDTATLASRATDAATGGTARTWFLAEGTMPLGITSNIATRVGTAYGVASLPVATGRLALSVKLNTIPTTSNARVGIRGVKSTFEGYYLTVSPTAYTPAKTGGSLTGAVSLGAPIAGDVITLTAIGSSITYTINRSGGTLVGTQTFTDTTHTEQACYISLVGENTSAGYSFDDLLVVQK